MRTLVPVLFSVVLSTLRLGAADQADNVIMAAMKLSAAPNYSWTTTVDQATGSTVTRGQTTQEGYALITFNARPPAMATVSTVSAVAPESGPETTAIYKGDSKYVVQDGNGWALPKDTAKIPAIADPTPSPAPNGARGARGQGARGGGSSSTNRRGRSRGNTGSTDGSGTEAEAIARPWAPPPALNLPHEELAIIVANHTNLQFAGDVVSGKLTESGADLLLLPPGSTQVPPKSAGGTFRLWITDGAVTKYEMKLTAKQTPNGHDVKGGFAETITVELRDAGTTKFAVPAAARQKLGF